jgi:DNA-binding CsgD family transcriptional regulator
MKAIKIGDSFDVSDEEEQSKSAILRLELNDIYSNLTEKEKKIFDLLSEGYSQIEISKICNTNSKFIYRLKQRIKKSIMSDLS